MNYLCLLLPLFGIFTSKSLERSPLRPFGLESTSARKQSKSNAKLIDRTHLKGKSLLVVCAVLCVLAGCRERPQPQAARARHVDGRTVEEPDTLPSEADTLLMDEELAESPLPETVDETFDDFAFAFDQSNRLQRQRILFPLDVVEADGERHQVARAEWEHQSIFLGQDYCTVLWNSSQQMALSDDSCVNAVRVEQIYLHSRVVESFHFERDTLSGKWMLTMRSSTPFEHFDLLDFLEFYRQFATDSVYQRQHVHDPLLFSMTYEDSESGSIEGTIDVDQWFEFAPEMPQDVITNIRYGQNYPNPNRIVMQMRGFSNSLQNLFTFRRNMAGQWELTAFEN